jgi:hypothetical protein
MNDPIKYFSEIKKNLNVSKTFKYYCFTIYYNNDNDEFDFNNNDKNLFNVDNLKTILKYFIENCNINYNIFINILDNKKEKEIHEEWKYFLSGFYNKKENPKTIYLTRISEWQRTLIHELVHCCYAIYDETKTEYKTISIYKDLFGLSTSQMDHSNILNANLINKFSTNFSNNLSRYISAYISYYKELNNYDISNYNCRCKCKCNFNSSNNNIFRYLCI